MRRCVSLSVCQLPVKATVRAVLTFRRDLASGTSTPSLYAERTLLLSMRPFRALSWDSTVPDCPFSACALVIPAADLTRTQGLRCQFKEQRRTSCSSRMASAEQVAELAGNAPRCPALYWINCVRSIKTLP